MILLEQNGCRVVERGWAVCEDNVLGMSSCDQESMMRKRRVRFMDAMDRRRHEQSAGDVMETPTDDTVRLGRLA